MNELSLQADNLLFCEETINLSKAIEVAFVEKGRRLMLVRDESKYLPQWSSFTEYLDEMKMKESHASRLITVYRRFVLECNISPEKVSELGGWSIAYELHRLHKDNQKLIETVDTVSHFNTSHLRQAIKEAETGINQDTCLHPDIYRIDICPECGFKAKVYEEN